MKKITLMIATALVATNMWAVDPTWTRVWENSATLSTNPTYIGTSSNVRGMGVGTFESEKVVVIPTREGGNAVKLLKAIDGTEWKNLNVTGITGGTFAISDAGVTMDGKILVANMVMSAAAVFKVYRWDNSTDAPTVAISYTLTVAHRIGDHITVKGSIADGSAKVYAMSTALVSTKATIFRFDMMSDGNGGYIFNNTPTIITNQIAATGGYASVDLMADGKYIYKYNGSQMLKLNADGTNPSPAESSSSAIVGTGGNSVRFIMNRTAVNLSDPDTAYIAYFRYGASNERANIVKFPNGTLNSTAAAVSTYLPILGTNANGNGAGKVAIDDITANSVNVYVFSCNNGIGKYSVTWPVTPTSIATPTQSLRLTKSAGIIKVEGTTPASILLYNALGQKISSVKNSNSLPVSGLRGLHVVQINLNGKLSTQKIIL
jgi:hypothetical protein